MQSITIPQKDKGYNIAFTITDSNGAATNITGYTINIKTWSPDKQGTLLVNKACVIANASAGTCNYLLASGDFNTEGTYYAELEMTASGVAESTETFKIVVAESG